MSRIVTSLATAGALALALIAAPVAAAHDSMSSPTPLVSGVAQQEDTTSYTVQGSEQNTYLPLTSQCGSGQNVGVVKTAWYSIQGTGGQATVTTAGSTFDTILFAYANSARGLGVACNDDSSGALTSSISFPTAAGATYYLQAGTSCDESAWPCPAANGGTLRILGTVAPPPIRTDVDGDGVNASQFGGPDCNDNDVRVHPGALDTPGDGIDQNCDGHDAALRRPSALKVAVSIAAHVHKRYTLVGKLAARDVPAGSTVTVSCASKKLGCRFTSKSTSTKVATTIHLTKLVGKALTKAKLRNGATIEVRVTGSGRVGTFTRFTFRKGKAPTRATLCLPPGSTKPQKVCS
jgi:Putative metal-binding motif